MTAWIDAITSPLKAASETVQGLVNVRDQIKFGETIIKLQAQILAAQQGASAAQARETDMTEEIGTLKAHVAELEAWETDKSRYALERLPPGVFVYSLKPEIAGSEPLHSICQTCYQRGKKSILHANEPWNGTYDLICHECGTKDCTECLSRFSLRAGISLIDEQQPWPDKPRMPTREQKRSHPDRPPRL